MASTMSQTLRLAGLAGLLLSALATGAPAQQPTSVNPTASSVNEQKLLEALKPGSAGQDTINGRVSIPDKRSGNLIQPAGQDWRATHEGTLPKVGTSAILGMLGMLAIFFAIRGRIRVESGFSGQLITRFGGIERFAHWLSASSFMLLGFSGLNLTFGKSLLLPLVGPSAFSVISEAGKFTHNYVSFAFIVGLVLMFLLWVKDNFPHPRDWAWIKQGGGIVGNAHPPAGRFNFGQKLIFWVVIAGGAGLAVTGYSLMFPFRFTDLAGLQWANTLHGLIGVVMIAVIIAHIYIGSLGMQGAFSAMGTGDVDVNWAKEHHSVWLDKTVAKNPKALEGSATPAE